MQYPEIYCALHQGTDGDIEFYVQQCHRLQSLCEDRVLRILELGCGAGRLTLALVHAGFKVVGLDHSSPLLEIARQQAQQAYVDDDQVCWINGDMCDLHRIFGVQETFDVIIIAYNTLYCLADETLQMRCLQQLSSFLHPQGVVLCDAYQLPDPNEYIYETADDFEVLTVLSYIPGDWPFHDQLALIDNDNFAESIDESDTSLIHSSVEDTNEERWVHVGVEEKDYYQQDRQYCRIDYRYRWENGSTAIDSIEHRYLYVHQLPMLFKQAHLKTLNIYDQFSYNKAHIDSEHWFVVAQLNESNT